MGIENEIISGNSVEPIAIWGAGSVCRDNISILKKYCNIVAIADRNALYRGKYIEGVVCISPEEICNYAKKVIIAVMNKKIQQEIAEECIANGFEYCMYDKLLPMIIRIHEENVLTNVSNEIFVEFDPDRIEPMKKYIGISVPVPVCNLKCTYCYLDQTNHRENAGFKNVHDPKYIRLCLSRKNIGGSALIGLCGDGETLLSDSFPELCWELLKEGHYLHIVTNGVLTEKIRKIIQGAGKYAKHIFFKLSFHYLQLKERNLLEQFVRSVRTIEESEASYTIELMPHDELVEYIPEVIEFSREKFGALPQLTIGRDDTDTRKLLTKLSEEEFCKTWGVFQSEMFDMRMKLYMKHGKKCAAGKKGFSVRLETGKLERCVFSENVGNICDINQVYEFPEVEDACPLEYCYNCHVYAAFGIETSMEAPTYAIIRDRVMSNGKHWIKDDMRRFLDVKL